MSSNPFGNGNGGNKSGGIDTSGLGDQTGAPGKPQRPGGPEFAQQIPAGGMMPFTDPKVGPGVPQVGGQGRRPFKV